MGDAKTANATLPKTIMESNEVSEIKGALDEVSSLPFKNSKHIIIYVFLLLPIALLCIFLHLTIPLLRKEAQLGDDNSSKLAKPIILIFCFGAFVYLIFHMSFLFGVILTVHHTSDLYKGKSSRLVELLSRTATTWEKTVSSRLLSFLVAYSYLFLFVYLTLGYSLVSASRVATKFAGLVEFAIAVYHVYYMANSTLGYVIHILEEGNELKALEKARHLIGRGNTRAYLMLLLLQVGTPISLLLVVRIRNPFEAGILLQYAMECVLVVLISISQLCIFTFFTVLHYEMNKSQGGTSTVDGTISIV
ncbi:hypothetical protein Sjap_010719 [Stephania japonica]|uniref:Uncharacterized protein n=1 Tax=Stephania japonica TaxID=461633 RepID=A0AAP0JC60_9MAGN